MHVIVVAFYPHLFAHLPFLKYHILFSLLRTALFTAFILSPLPSIPLQSDARSMVMFFSFEIYNRSFILTSHCCFNSFFVHFRWFINFEDEVSPNFELILISLVKCNVGCLHLTILLYFFFDFFIIVFN